MAIAVPKSPVHSPKSPVSNRIQNSHHVHQPHTKNLLTRLRNTRKSTMRDSCRYQHPDNLIQFLESLELAKSLENSIIYRVRIIQLPVETAYLPEPCGA
jgi:hypothetical protein